MAPHKYFTLWIILFCFSILSGLKSQSGIPLEFTGLKRTQPTYLYQYLERLNGQFGGQLNHSDLQAELAQIRQQILNLPSISRVDYAIDTLNKDSARILFSIEEARTVFPIVNFGGIRGNFNFQLGFNDIHWRGRGQQLSTYYQNSDRQHNFGFYFRNPSVNYSRWGYAINLRRYAAIEPLYFPTAAVNYNYANLSLGLSSSYRLGPRQEISVGSDIFRERYRKVQSPGLEETPGPDELSQYKLLGKINHRLDRLDYKEQPTGFINESNFQVVHSFADKSWFFIYWNDLRYFHPLAAKSLLAARLRTGISTNSNSPFAPFVLDSQVNIRGSGNRIDRGTAQLILNLELRQTVWRDRQGNFEAQLVAFSDLGTWRNPGGELSDIFSRESFREFVGGGIRIVYRKAHDTVLRFDYGIDVFNKKERGVVAGFGQYF